MNTAPKSTLIKLAVATSAALVLAGCASSGKFSCSAPEGVSCMSTQQVYDMTSGSPQGATPVKQKKRSKSGNFASHQIGAVGDSLVLTSPAKFTPTATSSSLALGATNSTYATPRASGSLPALGGYPAGQSESVARLPAQVLRMWVAPWTDEAGDLHMPGYVYTEIKARRWTVGGAAQLPEKPTSQFDPNAWQPPAIAP